MHDDAIDDEGISQRAIVVLDMVSLAQTDLWDLLEFHPPHGIQLSHYVVMAWLASIVTALHQVQGKPSHHAIPDLLEGRRLVEHVQYNLVSNGNGNAVCSRWAGELRPQAFHLVTAGLDCCCHVVRL